MEPAETPVEKEPAADSAETPAASADTGELRVEAHDTVANIVPDAVEHTRPPRTYREAGDGGWRVWK